MKRSKKAIVAWVLLAVAAVLAGFYIFFDSIIAGQWGGKKAAVVRAYGETMLVTADKVEPYVGAEPYVIVYGKDKLGKDMIVWVSDSEIHAEYADAGITAEAAADLVKKADPDNRIIRSTPGKLEQDWVWEIYYERKQDGKTLHFYDYYRFSDGALIDTYQLG